MTNLPDNNDSPEKTQADSIATPRKGFDGASAQDRRHTNLFHERERETPSQTPPESNGVRPLRGPATAALSDNQAGASLQDFFDILHRQRWKLAAFIALSLAAATLVSLWLTPLYESSLAINVERRGNGVVGQEASAPSMSEMDQIMMTQVQLIESDPVLRPVAEEYHLLELENQFRFLDRAESGRLRKSKTILKRLKVTRAPNTSILRISYRAPDPKMAADIVTMIAKTYVEHAFDSREQSNSAVLTVVEGQLSDLHQKIVSSDAALAEFSKQLGFADPEQRASVLSARLLQLNSDYTTAQSERLRKQTLYNATRSGSIASAQVSNQSSMMDNALTRLNQAKSEFAKVSTIYGESHPEYQKALREMNEMKRQFDESRMTTVDRVAVDYRQAAEREQMAHNLLTATKDEVDKLTAKAFEYQRLKNESENYRKLYDDLERVTREQVLNRGFQEAILQIVDPARPSAKQAFPNLLLNLLAAFVLSGMLGVGGVTVLDALDGRIRTPAEAAKLPNVEVIAAMPDFGSSRASRMNPGSAVGALPGSRRTRLLLQYQEYVRNLRNSIAFTTMNSPLRSLAIAGPRSNIKAPNVIGNLAFSYARLGRKVLLIDANLRQPSLHKIFEKTPSRGLAEVISGERIWNETLIQVAREQLFLMPAGVMTDHSPDLLSQGIHTLLESAYKDFDLVLILTPPVLAAPESASLASSADAVLVMTCARVTLSNDLLAAYALLGRAQANIIGTVVNNVKGLIKPTLFTDASVKSRHAA